MVKIKYVLIILSSILLYSCMGESGDVYTYGSQAGVVKQASKMLIQTYSGDKITSDDLQNMSVGEGDCCLVDYKINFTSSENKDADIYDVDILNYQPVKSWDLLDSPDTLEFRQNETFWSFSPQRSTYVDGYLFIYPKFRLHYQSQEDNFSVSYSPDQKPTFDMASKRKYLDLYIRSTATVDPSDSIATSSFIVPQAFNIQKLVDHAVQKGYVSGDSLNLRFVYPAAILEGDKYSWTTSEIYTILLVKKEGGLHNHTKTLNL